MPPILLKRLLQLEGQSGQDLSSVAAICASGAACPSSVKQGICNMFGPVLHEIYGASELGAVTVMDPDNMLLKPLSCGKAAYGVELVSAMFATTACGAVASVCCCVWDCGWCVLLRVGLWLVCAMHANEAIVCL